MVVLSSGVEVDEQSLSHDGGQRDLGGLALGAELLVVRA